jgi:predicted phage terminase large subunit-like protein
VASWPILEPKKTFLENWHIGLVCEYLEACYYGEIKNLIINMPPRYMKSNLVTVCFPTWVWLKAPEKRFIVASYAGSLAVKHSLDRRALIKSPWYQRAWVSRYTMSVDQDAKTKFTNDKRGHMIATSVGGSATGEGADFIVIDDPLDPKMAASDLERDNVNEWHDQTISTRKDDKKTSVEIVVMQRLHEKDLSGYLLGKSNKWEHLCLPAEAPEKIMIEFPLSGRSFERKEGDILWPEREGPEELAERKEELGSSGYQGQYQQDPQISKEGFFHFEWWKTYDPLMGYARQQRGMFIDCAEVPGVSNDFNVFAVWDETKTDYRIVSVTEEQLEFPGLEQMTKDLYAHYKPDFILIEFKSAGIQLYQNLKAETNLPVLKYKTGVKSKVVRASGAQPTVEAGRVALPDNAPWVAKFKTQHKKFPNVDHDDMVDTTSMAIDYFKNHNAGTFVNEPQTKAPIASSLNAKDEW